MKLPAEDEFDVLKFAPEQGTLIREPTGIGHGC